jgi:hypothetical protein
MLKLAESHHAAQHVGRQPFAAIVIRVCRYGDADLLRYATEHKSKGRISLKSRCGFLMLDIKTTV